MEISFNGLATKKKQNIKKIQRTKPDRYKKKIGRERERKSENEPERKK